MWYTQESLYFSFNTGELALRSALSAKKRAPSHINYSSERGVKGKIQKEQDDPACDAKGTEQEKSACSLITIMNNERSHGRLDAFEFQGRRQPMGAREKERMQGGGGAGRRRWSAGFRSSESKCKVMSLQFCLQTNRLILMDVSLLKRRRSPFCGF